MLCGQNSILLTGRKPCRYQMQCTLFTSFIYTGWWAISYKFIYSQFGTLWMT